MEISNTVNRESQNAESPSLRVSSADLGEPNKEEELNPFKRKDTIGRTPPRARSVSLPDVEVVAEEDVSNRNKRKWREEIRQDSQPSPPGGAHEDGARYKTVVGKMCRLAKQLERQVNFAYKPKKELQEISASQALLAQQLQESELEKWFDEAIDYKPKQQHQVIEALESENRNLKREVEYLMSNRPEDTGEITEDISGKQCENCNIVYN